MSRDSNPGAATPYSLYKLYSKQAAATANPWALRAVTGNSLTFSTMGSGAARDPASTVPLLGAGLGFQQPQGGRFQTQRDVDSAPRAGLKVLSARGGGMGVPGLTLSMTSITACPRS